MYIPQSYHTHFALEAILEFLDSKNILAVADDEIPEELKVNRACFVSVFINNEMRGCMGTYEPFHEMLIHEIIQNTIHAAFGDKRFFTISKQELETLTIKVEVVGNYHEVTTIEEAKAIDINNWGVKVTDKLGNVGMVLPETNGISNATEAINLAIKKGAITELNPLNLSLHKFRVKEFL